MNALSGLIEHYYTENREEILIELEMRYGFIIKEDLKLTVTPFEFKGEDFAIGKVGDTVVLFVTVDWGEPSVNLTWV